MSEYGLELFDASGELIWSSDYRTLRIIKAGTVSLEKKTDAEAVITFPPVTERPQIIAQTTGRYWRDVYRFTWPEPGFPEGIEVTSLAAYVGAFEKNAEGKYYMVKIIVRMAYWNEYYHEWIASHGTGFENIPYVIFV